MIPGLSAAQNCREKENIASGKAAAKATTSVRRLRAEFKHKFGPSFDRLGYHGRPFFGYHCYGCGIHISRIVASKGLREQLERDIAKANNEERDTAKLRVMGKPTAQEPPSTLPDKFFRVPAGR